MKKNTVIIIALIFCLLLSACGNNNEATESTSANKETTAQSSSEEITAEAASSLLTEEMSVTEELTSESAVSDIALNTEMFTDGDKTITSPENAVKIRLLGDSIECDSNAVSVNKGIITISEEATYYFTGTLNDGMIYINADEKAKIRLIFDGVNITSNTNAPLYILSCDKVFVTLSEESENSLINGGNFTSGDGNNVDGAVFSKQDLTFNGNGSLTVSSPSAHAVVCKDDLVFISGKYTLNSASHGIDANDSVRVGNAELTVSSGKDGIHCENSDNGEKGFIYIENGSFNIKSEGDGISAGNTLEIRNGSFNIVSGGGSVNAQKKTSDNWGGFMGGMGGPPGRPGEKNNPTAENTNDTADSESIKGIKASGSMLISGGSFNIDSADDAIHGNSDITVSGGDFTIKTGDDGFHADETLTVTGCNMTISESYEGLEALHVKVQGGNILLKADDDGINAAGGTDSGGQGGVRGPDMFGGGMSSGNGSIVISGGNIFIEASGDGIDANGTLEITDGYITVMGPTQGDTATLDFDKTGTISGGTFIGTGASGMAQTFSQSSQGVISINAGNQSGGTKIILSDKNGNEILSYTPELSFAVVILSSPEIIKGETYTVTVGNSQGSFEAN